jgi:hypothetical protein
MKLLKALSPPQFQGYFMYQLEKENKNHINVSHYTDSAVVL